MNCIGANDQQRVRRERGATGRTRRLRPAVMALEGRELLSTLTIGNTNDSGAGSLRAAVNQANADGGGDTIVFSNLFNTPQTIALTSGQLTLTGTATTRITGPGVNLLTISGNKASGVFEIEGGAAALSGLTVTGGQSDRGAGLLNQGGTLSLTSVTVSGNVANDQGGGVDTQFSGTTTMTDCTISGNSTTNYAGGGLANLYSGSATLTNCTISGNSAPTGGGLYNNTGMLSLINCTVSGNTAQSGGGLTSENSSSISLTNTLVAGNTGGDLQGTLQPGSTNDLIGVNPLLAPLGDYGGPTQTMALLPGSPAIGGGTTIGVPATDQRGVQRSGHVDIGAFQSRGFTVAPVAGSTPQSAMLGVAFASPLAVTVTANNSVEPVDGGVIAFAAPSAGASAFLPTATAIIAGGKAQVIASAASAPGQYTVTASAPGIGRIGFSLTNTQNPSLVVNTTKDLPLPINGENSLRTAIEYADLLTGPQTITFDPAAFGTTPQTITLSYSVLTMNNPATTTIVGPGANLLTVDGGGKSQVFDIDGGSAAISGLTVTGGKADFGGGLYNDGGTLSLTECTVSGNSATFGGGVANVKSGTTTLADSTVSSNSASTTGGGLVSNSGTLELTNTTVSHNSAGYGGGLANLTTGTATVIGGTFSGNTASNQGGGLFSNGPSLSLTGTTVSGNSTPGRGGGLFNNGGTLELTGATVTGNSAYTAWQPSDGGGLFNQAGTTIATDCTISGNSTFQFGGGVCNLGTLTLTDCTISRNTVVNTTGGGINNQGIATLTNCTISGNSAGGGGGMYITNTTTLINCTVSGNSGENGGGLGIYSGNTTLTNTIVAGNSGVDIWGSLAPASTHNLIGGNPLLAPLGDYGGPTQTIALLPGSPAIGAGTTAGAPALDQRGQPRKDHNDIGAFQSQGFKLTPVNGSTFQSTPVNQPFKNPLAVTVTANNSVEPVDGGVVTFATPSADASATLSAATAVIAGGQASVTATANATPGRFFVTAAATGAGTVAFALTNTEAESLVLTTTRDVVDAFDDLTSLREAIAYANSHPGPDTITFDPAAFGKAARTIWLTGGPLVLTDPATTTIVGPGARRLTIKGDGGGRVFDIEGGSLELDGVTISGGRAVRGGGIRNHGGRLVLNDVVIRGNRARLGGGLYNDGAAVLSDVVIRGNRARIGSGLFSTRSATLTWSRSPAGRRG
jgi:fibronectin-binding autotransporter adhesin